MAVYSVCMRPYVHARCLRAAYALKNQAWVNTRVFQKKSSDVLAGQERGKGRGQGKKEEEGGRERRTGEGRKENQKREVNKDGNRGQRRASGHNWRGTGMGVGGWGAPWEGDW